MFSGSTGTVGERLVVTDPFDPVGCDPVEALEEQKHPKHDDERRIKVLPGRDAVE